MSFMLLFKFVLLLFDEVVVAYALFILFKLFLIILLLKAVFGLILFLALIAVVGRLNLF